MMATFTRFLFLMMSAIAAIAMEPNEITTFSGEKYENNLARDKLKAIWKNITATAFHTELPPLENTGFFAMCDLLSTSFLSQSFTNHGDQMQEGRPKHIHSRGTTVAINFIAKNSKYTGMFSTGAPYGILRLSLASCPSGGKYIPGIALKFFRNGLPSVNIMVMPSLDGQANPNLFTEIFTNVLPSSEMSITNYLLEWRFAKTLSELGQRDENPRALPLIHLAETDINGSAFFETTTPYRLILKPTNDAQILMKNMKENEDFRSRLEGTGNGIILFEVYARDREEKEIIYVGFIETITAFTASALGDKLFFAHPLDKI